MRISVTPKSIVLFFALITLAFTAQTAHAVQTVSSDTTLSADGSQNGVHFSADSTLTAPAGTTINIAANTNGVTTATNNTGSLSFAGAGTVTGIVGSSSSVQLKAISAGVNNSEVVFGGNVFAVTTNVVSTGTVTFNGNYTGTTVNFGGDGTVRVADTKSITAAVTTNTNNTGSLVFLGSGTMTGQVGSSANKLKIVQAGVANTVTEFSSDVFATTTTVASTGTLVFNGNVTGTSVNFAGDGLVQVADSKNIDAAITTSANNTGSVIYRGASTISGAVGSVAGNDIKRVDINGGIVTLNNGSSDYAVITTTVNSGGTFKMAASDTITGAVTLAGTGIMDVGATTTTITGVYTQAAGTTLKTTINNATTLGNIVATTVAPAVAAASTVNVTVAGYIPTGTAYTLIDAGAAGINAPTTITDNSATLSFATSVSSNDLILTATRNYAGVPTSGNGGAVGAAANSFAASGDLADAITAIDTLSAADVDAGLQQLDPDMNGGVNQAALNATNGFLGTVETRLNNARNGISTGDGQIGFSAGDALKGAAVWYQGFGAHGDQDNISGIAGYSATTYGGTVGLDWEMASNCRMGAAFSYATTDIDSNGSASNTDADNYQGTLYGTHDAPTHYLNGMVTFGWNTYDSSRRIQIPGFDRTAAAEYDGQQYSGKMTYGHKMHYANFTLIPLASVLYSHLELDGYTESGAGTASLTVDDQSYDFLQSGLGARIEIPMRGKNQKIAWVPELHAMWLYEYIGDEAETTARFTGGGASFRTTGFEPDQSSFNVGVGVTVYPQENLSLRFAYDAELRDDYTGHSGTGTLRWEF